MWEANNESIRIKQKRAKTQRLSQKVQLSFLCLTILFLTGTLSILAFDFLTNLWRDSFPLITQVPFCNPVTPDPKAPSSVLILTGQPEKENSVFTHPQNCKPDPTDLTVAYYWGPPSTRSKYTANSQKHNQIAETSLEDFKNSAHWGNFSSLVLLKDLQNDFAPCILHPEGYILQASRKTSANGQVKFSPVKDTKYNNNCYFLLKIKLATDINWKEFTCSMVTTEL